jgi:hypothetical protein
MGDQRNEPKPDGISIEANKAAQLSKCIYSKKTFWKRLIQAEE